MAQKHQPATGSTCPNPACGEPVEQGDLFCGACGYDLTAVPAAAGADRPTVALSVPGPAGAAEAPGRPAGAVAWPEAARAGGPVAPATQDPADLPGVDSAGVRLPTASSDFELAAPGAGSGPEAAPGAGSSADGWRPGAAAHPDPRVTDPAELPAAEGAVCVACRAGRVDDDGYCENCGHAQPRERDHVEQELDAVAAVSDRGLRHHRNEDSFAVSSASVADGSPAVVAIVCDGVSSATRPDEASAAAAVAATESLLAALPLGAHPQQAMHEAIVAAGASVNALALTGGSSLDQELRHHQNAPACTIVGAVVTGGLLVIGWVGDSRAYWVPDDRTTQTVRLTEDDSWAAQMVAAGLMNEAEAYADERAHAITGWLGADAYELEPHTASFKPDRPGVVVVCTDGLWNYAESPDEMAEAVPADAAARPLHAAQVLVGHALDGGGHDNVTVAVLPFALSSAGAGSGYSTS